MSNDKRRRELEREAMNGDAEAGAALTRMDARGGNIRSIMYYAGIEIGDWAYIECGCNYHEIGKLKEVGIDELGRAIIVLSHHRRKNDETTDGGPTFLFESKGGVVALPSTEITHAAKAVDRYGDNFTPWA